jgi:hypothetical protein
MISSTISVVLPEPGPAITSVGISFSLPISVILLEIQNRALRNLE